MKLPLLCLICVVLLLTCNKVSCAPIHSSASETVVSLPPDGSSILQIGNTGQALWLKGNLAQRWNPATGKLGEEFLLPKFNLNLRTTGELTRRFLLSQLCSLQTFKENSLIHECTANPVIPKREIDKMLFMPDTVVETPSGMLFIAGSVETRGVVELVTPQGKSFNASLLVQRAKSEALVLPDQSVLLMGGIVSVDVDGTKQRTNAVELITFLHDRLLLSDKLIVERLPDLPGPVRAGYSLVALSDGRVMVLGGTDSRYIGCSPCTANTFILDPTTRTWSEGPKMTEPRADASATLLPDGSVLVVGGWTSTHGWGGAGTRTVEHWNPVRNEFVKNTMLPTGVARHKAWWVEGEKGKRLLVAGGNSAAVQAYDVTSGDWRLVGEFCQGNETGGRIVIPVVIQNQHYLVHQDGETNGIPCERYRQWNVVPLRMQAEASNTEVALRFDRDKGIALYRGRSTFLPGEGNAAGLVVGGSIHAGMNNYIITAAVDAILPNGSIKALPILNHARSDGKVFRLPDNSVLLVGGQVNVGGYDHTIEKASSAEWLPGNSELEQRRWQPFELFGAHDVLGQMADGSLIALGGSGEVSRIKIKADAQGKPQAESSQLPPLSQPRLIPAGTNVSLVVRGLPDGRIIVAGGAMQNKRLAIMHEDSMDPDAADEYLRIGEAVPTGDYEIYEPASGQWRQSAASRGIGGLLAVYDDGRVARLTANPKKSDESWSVNDDPLIEISSADGRSWSELGAEELPVIGVEYNTRMFVSQDELFIAGEKLHTNIATLQWFNGSTRRWETLWQAEPGVNWRNDVGRIIIRQLGNGKQVMLPVAGL